jgi:hypothetical protein
VTVAVAVPKLENANGERRRQREWQTTERVALAPPRAHGVVAWGTQEFWEEGNRHGRASIYTTQIISSGSR